MSSLKNTAVDKAEGSTPGFVSRWSLLKHEATHNDEENTTTGSIVETSELDDEAEPPEKILTDEDMPDITLLTDDSDYRDFLSPGVSEALRKLALRRLFHSEVFNIRDGLDEYDGDYTQFVKLGDTVTSDMRHQLEMEAKRKARELLQKEEIAKANGPGEDVVDADENNLSVESGLEHVEIDTHDTLQIDEVVENERVLNSQQSDKADDNEDLEQYKDNASVEIGNNKNSH